MRAAANLRRARYTNRVRSARASGALIDVDRVDAEMRGEEPIVIDWRTARVRDQGYSAKILGYEDRLYSIRALAHVRTKDIARSGKDARGRPYSKYGPTTSHRFISPRTEQALVKYYLAYGPKIASEVLGLPAYLFSAVAHRNGVQRTKGAGTRFHYQGKTIIEKPTRQQMQEWDAEFLKERRAYQRGRRSVDIRPEGFIDVPGWEGHYAAHRDGRVWSYPPPGKLRGCFLKHNKMYRSKTDRARGKFTMIVILGRMVDRRYKTQNFTVPQLIARTFLPNPDGKRFVHVKDGNSAHCNAENLEWMNGYELSAFSHAVRAANRTARREGKTVTLSHLCSAPEGFVDVPGYEGFYAVSRDGRVWSYPRVRRSTGIIRGRILRPGSAKGHPYVMLSRDGRVRGMHVHRMVALAFVPNPDGKKEVRMKNGVGDDIRAENLEWRSPSERATDANHKRWSERRILLERGWAAVGKEKPPSEPRGYGKRFTRDKPREKIPRSQHPWRLADHAGAVKYLAMKEARVRKAA